MLFEVVLFTTSCINAEKLFILNKWNSTNDPVLFDWRDKVDKHQFVKKFKNPSELQVWQKPLESGI